MRLGWGCKNFGLSYAQRLPMKTRCLGCGRLIPTGSGGRCSRCQSPSRKARSSSPWRRTAEAIVASADGICDSCHQGPGQLQADHIRPLEDGGDLLDPGNIWALCHPCHVRKTNHERWLRAQR